MVFIYTFFSIYLTKNSLNISYDENSYSFEVFCFNTFYVKINSFCIGAHDLVDKINNKKCIISGIYWNNYNKMYYIKKYSKLNAIMKLTDILLHFNVYDELIPLISNVWKI